MTAKGPKWRRWREGVRRYVYAAYHPVYDKIKIGCSVTPVLRMKHLGGRASDVRLLAFVPGGWREEARMLARLAPYRSKTFRTHSKEWFEPTPEVMLAVSEMMFFQRARKLKLDRVK